MPIFRDFLPLVISLVLLFACSADNEFSGSGKKKVAIKDSTEVAPEEGESVVEEQSSEIDETITEVTPKPVTKGVFTVWAEPPMPIVNQSYYIYISIDQGGVTPIKVSGDISGSDGYIDAFGGLGNQSAEFVRDDGALVVRVPVPGSTVRKVKDNISVSILDNDLVSPLPGLSENLELVFQ